MSSLCAIFYLKDRRRNADGLTDMSALGQHSSLAIASHDVWVVRETNIVFLWALHSRFVNKLHSRLLLAAETVLYA